MLTNRSELGKWLTQQGLLGEGVEVGVADAAFTKAMLPEWKGTLYHMVDPWEEQPEDDYPELTNKQAPWTEWFKECERVAQADQRCRLHKGYSVPISREFPNESLDWVYIDGAHDWRNIWADLEAWWPKVKVGGFFGGHDYLDRIDRGWCCHVESAVHTWMYNHKLPYCVLPCTSWYLIK